MEEVKVGKNQPDRNSNRRKVSRRKAVKKMGKYAVYTAPTLTSLLVNAKAAPGSPI
jgi:hypothetical protein